MEVCERCEGSGHVPSDGSPSEGNKGICSRCSGTGRLADICTDCMSTGGAHSRLCPTQPYMQEIAMLRAIVEPFSGFATTTNAHRMKRQDKCLAAAMAALIEWEKS